MSCGRLLSVVFVLAFGPSGIGQAETRPSLKSYLPRCLLIVRCTTEVKETTDDYLFDYKVVEVLKGEYSPLKMEGEPPKGYLYRTQMQTKKAQAKPVDGQELVFFFSDNGLSLGKLFRHDDAIPLKDGKMNWSLGREPLVAPELYSVAELKKLIAEVEKERAVRPAKLKAPDVKCTAVKQADGFISASFEVTNPNEVPLPYVGYTSDSFEGGLKEGTIAPIFRIELKKDGKWNKHAVGFCGTGIGPVTLRAKSKVTFGASLPLGEWDATKVGLTWWEPAADENKAVVAWSGEISRPEGKK
jgi:hypothetical protein